MGRCGVLGAEREDTRGHTSGAEYDQPPREDPGRGGPGGEAQEPDHGTGAGQGGVAYPRAEACFRLHSGALSRVEEEPPVAVCGLRFDQHLSASPETRENQLPVGPARSVVCLPEAV